MIKILDEKGYTTTDKGKAKFQPIRYLESSEGCWVVQGRKFKHTDDNTYAVVTRNGKNQRLHRYVYKLYKGEIPNGMVVRHLCHNKSCINPEHLEIGTQKDNVHDNYEVGSILTGSKHGLAKLTRNEFDKVTSLLSQGMGYTEVQKITGVCRNICKKIAKGTHWSCKEYAN